MFESLQRQADRLCCRARPETAANSLALASARTTELRKHALLVTDRDIITNSTEYSTKLYTDEAAHIIASHPADKPLFLYLPYQAVHVGNKRSPPGWSNPGWGLVFYEINAGTTTVVVLCHRVHRRNGVIVYVCCVRLPRHACAPRVRPGPGALPLHPALPQRHALRRAAEPERPSARCSSRATARAFLPTAPRETFATQLQGRGPRAQREPLKPLRLRRADGGARFRCGWDRSLCSCVAGRRL